MKKQNIFGLVVIALLSIISFSACSSKDDVYTPSADIISLEIDNTYSNYFLRQPSITNDEVRFYTDTLNYIKVKFNLSEGATTNHVDTVLLDLSTPKYINVTSLDGRWTKTYKIYIVHPEVPNVFHLDSATRYIYDGNELFDILTEKTELGTTITWASANSGFMLTNSTQNDNKSYPTALVDEGYQGKCVKLQTLSTGFLGSLFGSPIAAGNLFLGEFSINMSNTLKSTHFGVPYKKEPITLNGYYKYQPGAEFRNRGTQVVADKKDTPSIYAVLFETTQEVPYLDGTNSLTSPNIVKIARVSDAKETNEWTRFSVPFTLLEGKTIDQEKLESGKYSLSIILSSSADGANFNGALGSTLWVDEITLDVK